MGDGVEATDTAGRAGTAARTDATATAPSASPLPSPPSSLLPALPPLDHLARMTDGTGLLQHARYSVPDRRHGYCLDDNARALWLVARWPTRDARVLGLATTYAAFVDHAWDRDAQGGRGRFENFMDYGRQWLPDGSTGEDEDAQARGVLALTHAALSDLPGGVTDWAGSLLVEALRPPALPLALGSPRAWAAALVACRHLADADDGSDRALVREAAAHAAAIGPELAGRLLALYRAEARADWPWFERALAYDNARLCEGALAGARWEPALLGIGLDALRWLCAVQRDAAGRHRPFGNAGFGVPGLRVAPHDQQPIEAWATADACRLAHELTGDPAWRAEARRATDWFGGANETGQSLVDAAGGCADGIGAGGANRNRGAESTLAALHAALNRW